MTNMSFFGLLDYGTIDQSWALAHLFEVRYPLTTQFFPMDR
jgi:hypothetical protein